MILRSLPKVVNVLVGDVRRDGFTKGSQNTMVFCCCKALPKIIYPYTQCSLRVPSPATGPSVIEPCSNLLEKDQSLLACGMMHLFEGRAFENYIANLSASVIPFSKNTITTYAFEAPDFFVCHREVSADYGQPTESGFGANNSCIRTKPVQKSSP